MADLHGIAPEEVRRRGRPDWLLLALHDELGSGPAHDAAELRLITGVLKTNSYTESTGRRLYTAAAKACRLAGWCSYDSGRLADAEKRFEASLRASATADDITLAFWANLRYRAGDPYGALGIVERALDNHHEITSGRVVAMLHARAARAHSTAGEPKAAYRAIDAAFAAYDQAGSVVHDLPSMYWFSHGECHEVAASCALALGEPARELEHFDAALRHEDPYDTGTEARGAGIYLARRVEAPVRSRNCANNSRPTARPDRSRTFWTSRREVRRQGRVRCRHQAGARGRPERSRKDSSAVRSTAATRKVAVLYE
jgi:tetratricopeptide (TPR) repeat protein